MTYVAGAEIFPNGEIRVFCRPNRAVPQSRRETHKTDSEIETAPIEARAASAPPPLDSRSDFQGVSADTKKRGWGLDPRPTTFGLNARRTLLRVGGAIDRMDIPQSRQLFLTGTLPGSTDESMRTIAAWSGYIINRLKTWVSDIQGSKLDFYVWERQKRGALHLHYFVVASTDESARQILHGFRAKWIQILDSVSEKAGTSLFLSARGVSWRDCPSKIQAYAQSVRVGVAAYLAKYCSKNSGKQSPQQSSQYFPSRWWGCSRPLLNAMRQMTSKVLFDGLPASSASYWYNRILDRVERAALVFYHYGERRGYQRFGVAYSPYRDSKLIFEELLCLKIPILDSSPLIPTEAVAIIQRLSYHLQLRLSYLSESFDRSKISCSVMESLNLILNSTKVSQLIVRVESCGSRLNLWWRELTALGIRRLGRITALLDAAQICLMALINDSATDWHIDIDPIRPLKFALTQPNPPH